MTEVPEDQVRDLERGADEMEKELGRLEGDLSTAHDKAAEQRERANPEAAAGDWQEESTAAHQGDDATEASRSPGDEDGGGTAVADAPVHEATEVTPGEASGEGDERDAVADAPVHEAEEVEPSGSAGDEGGDGEDDASRDSSSDAPVHEAEKVEPRGDADRDED
jgi:hypothetical protein